MFNVVLFLRLDFILGVVLNFLLDVIHEAVIAVGLVIIFHSLIFSLSALILAMLSIYIL